MDNKLIGRYEKINGEWVLQETIKDGTNHVYIMLSGAIHLIYPDTTEINLNTDFNSKDCHTCYSVIK